MTCVHVHRERFEELARTSTPPRWCFACRKRLPGVLVILRPADPMSYYGPHESYRCDGCGNDRRLGFGMGNE